MTFDRTAKGALDKLIDRSLVAVRYVQLLTEDGTADWRLTEEFDSVDVSVELDVGGEVVTLGWSLDHVTRDYRIDVRSGSLEYSGDLAAKVNVTDESGWRRFRGERIVSWRFISWRSDSSKEREQPAAVEFTFANDGVAIVAVAEWNPGRQSLMPAVEGITVFYDEADAASAGLEAT